MERESLTELGLTLKRFHFFFFACRGMCLLRIWSSLRTVTLKPTLFSRRSSLWTEKMPEGHLVSAPPLCSVAQGQAESGGMVLVAFTGPYRQRESVLRQRYEACCTYLPGLPRPLLYPREPGRLRKGVRAAEQNTALHRCLVRG